MGTVLFIGGLVIGFALLLAGVLKSSKGPVQDECVIDPEQNPTVWDSATVYHQIGERQQFKWPGESTTEIMVRELKLWPLDRKIATGWYAWGEDNRYWQYYCPTCHGEITPGPSGAGTNQVCEFCLVNYGCLPGALER